MKPAETKILIVDDEPSICEIVSDVFEFAGFKTMASHSGNDAWNVVQSKAPHIVISDIRMPNGDGMELLTRIRQKDKYWPRVFIITGYSDFSIDEVLDRGADGLFAKPFNAELVRETVKKSFVEKDTLWARKYNATVKTIIHKNIDQLASPDETNSVSIGRGGLFLQMDSDLPDVGEMVKFHIDIEDGHPVSSLEGHATVSWIRSANELNLPTGIGVEIFNLAPPCIKPFIDYLSQHTPTAFIPRL